MPLALVAIGQTHALLVGYLDLSVGAMVTLGVVIALVPDRPRLLDGPRSLLGVGVVFAAAWPSGSVNAVSGPRASRSRRSSRPWPRSASSSGISLTLRATPGGSSIATSLSLLANEIGPIPIAFIVIVDRGRRALDLLAPRHRVRVSACARPASTSARRSAAASGPLDPGAGAGAVGAVRGDSPSFLVMTRSGIGNAQIGDSYALSSITAAVLGGAALSGGRATFIGGTVAVGAPGADHRRAPVPRPAAPSTALMITGVLVLLGIILFQAGDIKELVKRNYKRARRRVIGSRVAERGRAPRPLPVGARLPRGADRTDADPRTASCSASIRSVGDFATADVLIEHGDDRRDRARPGDRRKPRSSTPPA